MKNHKIGASLLSIPFRSFLETYPKIIHSGIDFVHLDIMDGNFVPNIAFSPHMIHEIKALSPEIPFDIHFMITSLAYTQTAEAYLSIQPTRISVHMEVFPLLEELMVSVKKRHIEFGIAVNPDTPIEPLKPFLSQLDFILLMSVQPGFGGQTFRPAVLEKARELDLLRKQHHYSFLLEVDGGLQLSFIPSLASSGIDLFIIGSDLVKQANPTEYVSRFRSLCQPYS